MNAAALKRYWEAWVHAPGETLPYENRTLEQILEERRARARAHREEMAKLGVANLGGLRETPKQKEHLLVDPPTEGDLQ